MRELKLHEELEFWKQFRQTLYAEALEMADEEWFENHKLIQEQIDSLTLQQTLITLRYALRRQHV